PLSALLPPSHLRTLARRWLHEDCPGPDPAALLVGLTPRRAHIVCKSPGLLAGLPFADAVWAEVSCVSTWKLPEGDHVTPGTVVAEVTGPAARILQGERVVLELLSRCSGTATAAARAVGVGRGLGWKGAVGGTRKTTPGFRLVEKYGLRVGGADPHRYDLGGTVMVKDTHRDAAGIGMGQLVLRARRAGGWSRRVEAECGSAAEALQAALFGADIVLLDNMEPQELHAAAAAVKAQHPTVTVEASGGITEEALPLYVGPNVDAVSMGSLTHSARPIDFALRVVPGDDVGQ
ncbi:nicotinate-nucleotide pyrophosphorylase [carboxylating], partial [Gallus gallus]